MACTGTTSGEQCGGRDKITAYEMGVSKLEYRGCYADVRRNRAMNSEGKYVEDGMTTEVCVEKYVVLDC